MKTTILNQLTPLAKFRGFLSVLCLLSAACNAPAFNYPDFSSTSGLNLTGSAAQVGTAIRLTPAAQSQKGAAWYTQKQFVGAGFTTTFTFRITSPGNGGGGGLSFAIQNGGRGVLGTEYGAEKNSVVLGPGILLGSFFNPGIAEGARNLF